MSYADYFFFLDKLRPTNLETRMPQNKNVLGKASDRNSHPCVICCFVFSAIAMVVLGMLAFLVWNQPRFIDGLSSVTKNDPANSVGSLVGAVGVYGIFFIYCGFNIGSKQYGSVEETTPVSGKEVRSYGLVPATEPEFVQDTTA